jgi:release factor glutamine methyltransferase
MPSSPPEPERIWTVRDVTAFAADDFRKRGIESPRLEAEILLCRELGLNRTKLILEQERPLSREELSAYRALIARRRAFEPIAYILAEKEFYGRVFQVDRRVLVPRPDTEILIDVALARTRPRSLSARTLDLCTGSGCVAVTLACERPTWQVTGADISAAALEVARSNALAAGAVWGVRWIESDLFSALPARERFELITANPPYIPTAEMASLSKDIRDYEPHLALDGGADGLSFYRRIIKEALNFLTSGGVLALEIGWNQAKDVSTLLAESGYEDIQIAQDYGSRDRVASAKAPVRRG